MSKYKVELLDQCPELPIDAPLFGSKRWWDFQKKIWGEDLYCCCCSSNSDLIAWVFLIKTNRGPWSRAVPIPYTPYGGPYFNLSEQKYFHNHLTLHEEVTQEIARFLANSFDQVLLFPQSDCTRALYWQNWRTSPRFTLLTDLNHKRSQKFAWTRTIKRNIDKSKSEFKLSLGNHSDWIKHCLDILFHNKVYLPKGPQILQKWDAHLAEINDIKSCHLLDADGNCRANFIWVEDHKYHIAYALWIGGDLSARKQGAYYQMVDFCLRQLPNTIHFFDHCGADHPAISEFKSKFSDHLQTKHNLETTSSRILKWIDIIRRHT